MYELYKKSLKLVKRIIVYISKIKSYFLHFLDFFNIFYIIIILPVVGQRARPFPNFLEESIIIT